jgi:fumarate hydratase class II
MTTSTSGQSSNDVIPDRDPGGRRLAWRERCCRRCEHLRKTIDRRAAALGNIVKTGRTHLMDAMPLTLAQEIRRLVGATGNRRKAASRTLKRLRRLPLGGTAIGTGINADPRFGAVPAPPCRRRHRGEISKADNLFEGLAAQDGGGIVRPAQRAGGAR